MQMLQKRIIFLGLLHFMVSSSSIAQNEIEKFQNLQSPNVASLGVYGEVPVSPFTGTPNIDIPLYSFYVNRKKFPISLSYHPSAVKPDQHPGWVGLGWTLNAGGVIYRKINDVSDELIFNGEEVGFYYSHAVLDTMAWNSLTYLNYCAENLEVMKLDTSPDEFSFNFMGYTGKFFLNHLGSWIAECEQPIKIEFDGAFSDVPFSNISSLHFGRSYPQVFSGFTIITEDGTKYIFGKTEDSIEYSMGLFQENSNMWSANAWYLTKIVYGNGQTVELEYQRGDIICQMYNSMSLYKNFGSGTWGSFGYSAYITNNIKEGNNGTLIAPVYLNKISYPHGHIEFHKEATKELTLDTNEIDDAVTKKGGPDTFAFLHFYYGGNYAYPDYFNLMRWYQLNRIQICNDNDKSIVDFSFSYSNDSTKRLILNAVQESSFSKAGRKYTFSYNHPEMLPSYLSGKTDHWGFYNNTVDQIPPNYDFSIFSQYKEPTPEYASIGLLNKITYPTGGYTKLIFEPHQYRKVLKEERWEGCEPTLESNAYAGGARIKKIITSPTGQEEDEYTDREYLYTAAIPNNTDTISSGVLGGRNRYYYENYIAHSYNCNDDARMDLFSSHSVLPASHNAQGCHIGYTNVIEKNSDGSYKKYKYSNFDNGFLDEHCDAIIQDTRMVYNNYSSKDQERGLLIESESYDVNNILRETESITYTKDKLDNNYVRMMEAYFQNTYIGSACSYGEGVAYRSYIYTMKPSWRHEVTYEPGSTNPIIKDYSYSYNSCGLLSQTFTNSSINGDIETDIIHYPSDMNLSNNTIYRNMVNRNFFAYPVEKIHLKNNDVTSASLYNYKPNYSDFVLDKTYTLKISHQYLKHHIHILMEISWIPTIKLLT